jgi:DHA1 family tetracycline resistance protein-like MFS transporter
MKVRLKLLYLFALVMNSSVGVLAVGLPLLAIRFGATPLQLGLLGSAGPFVYAVTCMFSGRLSDYSEGGWWGRRQSLIGCCTLAVAVNSFIFFVSGIGALCLISCAGFFCTAFFWPPLQAWLADVGVREKLPESLGVFNLSWSIGMTMGLMMGGFLFAMDYRLPWCYVICANALLLLLLLFGRTTSTSAPKNRTSSAVEAACNGNNVGKFLSLALCANFVCWFCLANVQSLYPKLAVSRGFSPQLIGFLMFLIGLVQALFFVMLRATRRWHFRFGPLVAVHLTAAAGMTIVFAGRSVPLLVIAFAMIGGGLGISYYSSIYYSLCAAGGTGKRTGIHEFMVGSAFFLGPLAGGVCAHYLGLRAPFLLCAALLGVMAAWEAVQWTLSLR